MKKIIVLALAASLAGCAVQRFEVVKGNTSESASYDDSHSFFIGGIGQSKDVDAAAVCGGAGKVAKVETELTPGNVGMTFLTLFIYTPRQIRVYCTK